ncbi:MAG: hypothetical protein OEZ21_00905 [Candidatus Bathyarchaeota archaeon]|nr:hypothetical protein [Candidatus Bathyarchaeota archaeon]MDH5745500.1 hypothetical protein [Candidatus Bathyarchaeota archaeon]
MAEAKKDFGKRLREITFKALKATIKGVLFYGTYFVLSTFLTPISEIFPNFQQAIEIFVMIYILFIITEELTSGTIFQCFFNTARALFVIFYLIFLLKSGVIGMTFQGVSLIVDLRLFLVIAMLLSLLGLAKSMLQAINFLNEKAEHTRV